MKIRMAVDMSGTLDGEPWPKRGEVADVDKNVAAKLLANGQAVKPSEDVDEEVPEVETATAPDDDVETTTAPKRGRPAKNDG